jgi:hypothetical protein
MPEVEVGVASRVVADCNKAVAAYSKAVADCNKAVADCSKAVVDCSKVGADNRAVEGSNFAGLPVRYMVPTTRNGYCFVSGFYVTLQPGWFNSTAPMARHLPRGFTTSPPLKSHSLG